jgi:Zn-dependent protease with chaperone function
MFRGNEVNQVAEIADRLAVVNSRIYIAVAMNPLINAWDVELSDTSVICVSLALVHAMRDSEGELAFILAHEIGHATDDLCKSLGSRARLADQSKLGALLFLLFGRGTGDGPRDQRACESRADELGVQSMIRAGYKPEDAVAALERLAAYSGATASGPIARLGALGKDHPITADRVRHIRKTIAHQQD